nr:PAS domain S-box protein [Altererythrobacter sp. KTW20L]
MGWRIAEHDWTRTSLGPISQWPESLCAITAFLVNSPVPLVMLWGEEGTMIYNDAYSAFAGHRHPRIFGLPVLEAWPEVADFNANVMKVGLAGGTLAYKDHLLQLNRTGQLEDAWLNLDYSPVFDDHGNPAGVMAIVVETTDTVRANMALRESEARLRFLDRLGRATAASRDADAIMAATTRLTAQQLGVAICAYADMDEDGDGFTIRGDWTDEQSASIIGHYSLAEFGETAVRKLNAGLPLVVNDNRAELSPAAAEAFRRIGIGSTVCMPLVKQGRLLALMAIHHRKAHHWTETEIATIREVTERSWAHIERVRTEAELRATAIRLRDLNETLEMRVEERSAALERTQTLFRLLVQGVTDYAIYVIDEQGHITSWNAGAERIKGYTPAEALGRHFSQFYLEEDRAAGEPQRALDAARREGRHATEGWRLRKDGSRFHASVVIDAIKDEDGNLLGFAKITRDITEREEAARELELAREALFQAQKMEAIGQLTGGIAHDFNNLLTAIRSGLELLSKREMANSQSAGLIANCQRAVSRGAALIQRMLAFARRQELATEVIPVASLVTDMMELLRSSLGPGVRIEMRLPDNLPPALGDKNQLEMALLNLAVNARDAMPDGGLIVIEATDETVPANDDCGLAPGHYVCLSVTDSGKGMDAETLARATDPFFTTKGVGKGTGLGLSMVHGLAQQVGGRLSLKSTPGEGTRAEIWLPVATAGPVEAADIPASPHATAVVGGRRILVVDDDVIILMNTVAMLEDLGHVALEAGSGEDALRLLEQGERFDLLITDEAMPGMKGSELVAAARGIDPQLPVIVATGYGETPGALGGTVQRLGKPFGQDELRRAVDGAGVR